MPVVGLRDIKDAAVWIYDKTEERNVKVPVTEDSIIIKRRPTSVDIITPAGKNRVIVGTKCDARVNLEPFSPPYLKCAAGAIIENMDTDELIRFMKGQEEKTEVYGVK